MRKIILANEKEFEINRCGAADGYLWIGFPDGVMDFTQAVQVLSDVEATKKIISTYDFEGMETVYEGYTELQIIQKEYGGTLLVSLKKVS
jgi:hypothetical protein